jgi:hypothetical protein
MSKRITKAQLLEQLEQHKKWQWDQEMELLATRENLQQAYLRLSYYSKLASVRLDELKPEDQYSITMRVDRRHFNSHGKHVLRDIMLNMFADASSRFACDELPDRINEVIERGDIKNFLAEWLFITAYLPVRNNIGYTPPSMSFWLEVVNRLFAAVDALKKAGVDNLKLRHQIMFEAYNNPIKL